MKDSKIESIISEDGAIVNLNKLKKNINSEVEKCICKIIIEEKPKQKSGIGFICYIKQYNKKVIITNNHVINEDFLKNKKKLKILIDKKKKEINFELQRYKSSDKELDYTMIEIREEDGINNYLEIDEDIYKNNYENELIFMEHYSGGDELNYSHGKIITKKKIYFYIHYQQKKGHQDLQ